MIALRQHVYGQFRREHFDWKEASGELPLTAWACYFKRFFIEVVISLLGDLLCGSYKVTAQFYTAAFKQGDFYYFTEENFT